ncbi:MAG TPA: helix-turn-helix transcriptional regulator, partial [Lachnospiraceae bacterium]|nr:helix-turn-helix transcriptional regulator [Lachnospiraceae bacterium]
ARLTKLGIPVDSAVGNEALQLIGRLQFSQNHAIVIDDYQQLSSPEINDFFEMLARSEMENLHIILNTRFSGFQKHEELALKGLLYHIRQEAFELRPEEIREYYKICGIPPSKEQVRQLFSMTEGWISALYLMMLAYLSNGTLETPGNIYQLIEKAVHLPLSDEAKDFILCVSVFDSFTLQQAAHLWKQSDSGRLLSEILRQNAFVNYDSKSKTYRIHSLYREYLQDLLNKKEAAYRYALYQRAADWYQKNSDYITARHFWHLCKDYENLLQSIENGKARNFTKQNLKKLQMYFDSCPETIRARHPYALLIFAVHLFVHNERNGFLMIYREANQTILSDPALETKQRNELLGELEILNGFSVFNDLKKMAQSFEKAWQLLGKTTSIYDIESDWTFGSPSILYLYYRESGKLKEHLADLMTGLPCYCRLTNGNGRGGEYVMEAEWYYHKGDLINAEISINKAIHKARASSQWSIALTIMFLQMRIAFMKGDYKNLSYLPGFS